MDINKYWTLPYNIRPVQEKLIQQIQSSIECDYKNIILEAGTGSGKSAIATTIARMNTDAYILTMTKQLQSQYANDFKDILVQIKGRSNYTCKKNGDPCDYGACQIHDENSCEDCPYITARTIAAYSDITLTNYDYLYYAGNYAHQLPSKNLLILDEAHNLESKLMSLISHSLSRFQIMKDIGIDIFYPVVSNTAPLKSLEDPNYWIELLYKIIGEYKQLANTVCLNNRDKNRLQSKIMGFVRLQDNLCSDENKWIIELPRKRDIQDDHDYNGWLSVNFKPLYVKNYSDALLDFGACRLFMTGTLGSCDDFCEWNGLNVDDTIHIFEKSPFPKSHRPIIKDFVGSMSRKHFKKNSPKALDKIRRIINGYMGNKGVIHVSSYHQAQYIKNNLKTDRIITHTPKNREEIICQFEDSVQPLVLISPSIKDGVDFKGDKCRFQIIFKVPYPSLAGTQVNVKAYHDPEWYAYSTVMPLMQAYGRGIRDEYDYCDTYILDADFDRLLRNHRNLFNEYFLEAIIE